VANSIDLLIERPASSSHRSGLRMELSFRPKSSGMMRSAQAGLSR
jgi:hypothetical protein